MCVCRSQTFGRVRSPSDGRCSFGAESPNSPNEIVMSGLLKLGNCRLLAIPLLLVAGARAGSSKALACAAARR